MSTALDALATRYARLVLAVGQHDADYVDAFYGPEAWREEAERDRLSLGTIQAQAIAVMDALERLPEAALAGSAHRRQRYLLKQLRALQAKVAMLMGHRYAFDEESLLLYDAVAPTHPVSHFDGILETLGSLLPGNGTLSERYHAYMAQFVIPKDRLHTVFTAAIEESRARTQRWITLPEGESFALDYVTNKPWSGYNWFKGQAYSLIQMNTDLPIYIDRAIDLASHEGYPGHHVYNTLLEARLVRERGWMEFSIYPLFSPQSLIAEGTANYGIEMAFPAEARTAFEAATLFPLAGLDASRIEQFQAVRTATEGLSYAGNEAARAYIDGRMTRAETVQWLIDHALASPERAEQRLAFFDANRSYVINYNLGQDLVKHHIESQGGTPDQPERRWELFKELLSEPWVPSELRHPA